MMECSPKEVHNKWCPHVQIATGGNQSVHNNRHFRCLGTDCMAWHELGSINGYCDLMRKDK